MKKLLIFTFVVIFRQASAQIELGPTLPYPNNVVLSVDYPKANVGNLSLDDALLFIIASRKNISGFEDYNSFIESEYDPKELALYMSIQQMPGVSSQMHPEIERIASMRRNIYISENYLQNGKELLGAINNLENKSREILKHIDNYAPWPTLTEANNPPSQITDIMSNCCGYMFWKNDYLFILGHLYKIKGSDSEFSIDFNDRAIYKESFEQGKASLISFDAIRESLLFGRELILADIREVIDILELYGPKLEAYNNSLPEIITKNRGIYGLAVEKMREYIRKGVEQESKWIDSTLLVSKTLREAVILHDSLISQYSGKYNFVQQKIAENEEKILNWRANLEELTKSSFSTIKELDSLRLIAESLLLNCNDQNALEDCVEFPDSLKTINEMSEERFQALTEISNRKEKLSSQIIEMATSNAVLSKQSEEYYSKFVKKRNDYQPIASAYLDHKNTIKNELVQHKKALYFLNELQDKFLITIGEKEDPLIIKLKESLRLNENPPRPGFPNFPKPSFPADPGWIDPIREELLKQREIFEISIDLNKKQDQK